jgi:hypothetical protein
MKSIPIPDCHTKRISSAQIRTLPKFQQTVETPLKNLPPFAAAITSAVPRAVSGSVTIDTWVFQPEHWIALLTRYSIEPRYARGICVTAVGREEIKALLEAAFGDWLDFIFIPQPGSFAIYADHDEYTTFVAQTRSNLNRVATAVKVSGAKLVSDYERRF